jgi:hypothetical protein
MLSAVELRGDAAGERAAARARMRVAATLRAELPGVAVTVEGDEVVLTGWISPDDARLRWIGSLLP